MDKIYYKHPRHIFTTGVFILPGSVKKGMRVIKKGEYVSVFAGKKDAAGMIAGLVYKKLKSLQTEEAVCPQKIKPVSKGSD